MDGIKGKFPLITKNEKTRQEYRKIVHSSTSRICCYGRMHTEACNWDWYEGQLGFPSLGESHFERSTSQKLFIKNWMAVTRLENCQKAKESEHRTNECEHLEYHRAQFSKLDFDLLIPGQCKLTFPKTRKTRTFYVRMFQNFCQNKTIFSGIIFSWQISTRILHDTKILFSNTRYPSLGFKRLRI